MEGCTYTPMVSEVPAYLLATGRRPKSKLPPGARVPGLAARRRRQLRTVVLEEKRKQQAVLDARQRVAEGGAPELEHEAAEEAVERERDPMEETLEEVLAMTWGPVARDPEPRGYKESVQRLRGAAAYRAAVSRVERGKELRPYGMEEEDDIEAGWEEEAEGGSLPDGAVRRSVGVEV